MTIALAVHPDLRKRSWRVRKLRTRNVCQLLGQSLNQPSGVVISWTVDGIPVVNLGLPEFSAVELNAILARVLAAGGTADKLK